MVGVDDRNRAVKAGGAMAQVPAVACGAPVSGDALVGALASVLGAAARSEHVVACLSSGAAVGSHTAPEKVMAAAAPKLIAINAK